MVEEVDQLLECVLTVCATESIWSDGHLVPHGRETLIQAVDTCLSSKVVSQNCETISPMAVDAALGIIDPSTATNVDLRDIKVNIRKIPGSVRQEQLGAIMWFPSLI